MLTRVLTPLDGSALSESILEQILRLLTREDSEVILLHVLPGEVEGSLRDGLIAGQAVQEYLDQVEARLTESGVRVRQEQRVGDPAEEILDSADELEPSLIAMTTHGRGGLDRWVRGSVAERVLHHSTHPLLLCSPLVNAKEERSEGEGFKRILVPLDDSDFSAGVIPLVEDIAHAYGAEVTLYRAVPLIPTLNPETLIHPAESSLSPIRESLEKRGLSVRVHVEVAPAAAGIIDAIEAEDTDLVAMATHGRSGISRWAFGSVADKVLRHSPVPLLMTRSNQISRDPGGA